MFWLITISTLILVASVILFGAVRWLRELDDFWRAYDD